MEKRLYVVHTLSGQEYKVKEMLESRIKSHEMDSLITQVLIPSEKVAEVKAGKKTISARKFFPGYLLVEMTCTDESYYLVRQTPGVIGFIGSGSPIPLQEHEIQDVLAQIEVKKEKVKPKILFEIGETVKVNDGPFINFNGTIDEVNPDRGRLKVLVTIFGRSTPVELEYWQVEKG
ncbi:MAG: transcription termination/antitermination protein NusG [Candidatus Aureabacteria bacterium]|nr:transcription termination/antitermination protein NusG [Candidatus Auribacterota bacterium]